MDPQEAGEQFAYAMVAACSPRGLTLLDEQLEALEYSSRLTRLGALRRGQLDELVVALGITNAHLVSAGTTSEYAQSILQLCRSGGPRRAEVYMRVIDEFVDDQRPTTHDELQRRYLAWVSNEYDRVRVFHGAGSTRRLNAVYVRLLSRRLNADWSYERIDASARADAEHERSATLDALLDTRPCGRWTLQGDPGSGKSTELRHLALSRARRALARLTSGSTTPPGTVPILVSLPELAEQLGGRRTPFELVAGDVVQTTGYRDIDREGLQTTLSRLAHDGRALLLLDGFDEVRPDRRERVLKTIGEYERHLRAPIVMASRRFGYQQPSEDFVELALQPLDKDRQRELLENWRLPAAMVDDILDRVSREPPLQDMASSPFLLTLIAFLTREHSRARDSEPLPRRRAAVYRQVVKRYIHGCARPDTNRTRVRLSREALHDGLRELSLSLLQEHAGPWTTAAIERHLREIPEFTACITTNSQIVPDLAADTGLLEPVGRTQGRWMFRHRAFLECLAAEALSKRDSDDIRAFATLVGGQGRWWNPWSWNLRNQTGRWAEVFALLAGLSDENPVALLAPLRDVNEALALRALANVEDVAPAVIIEVFGLRGSLELIRELMARIEETDELAARLHELSRKTRDKLTHVYLVAALQAIGADDELDRLERGALDTRSLCSTQPRWRALPAGSFWMGSENAEADGDERPRTLVVLTSPFEILSTPVTHALYAVVTGDSRAGEGVDPQRPIEGVSWREASDFCAALAMLQNSEIRLPTEAEWEYACRAGSVSRFCFGEAVSSLHQYAWFSGNSSRTTHRVARKEANAWGLYDMHGNVWEWCLDDLRRYNGETVVDPLGPLNTGWKGARGGSAWDEPRFVRSAFRVRFRAERRMGDCGFRCIRQRQKPPRLR